MSFLRHQQIYRSDGLSRPNRWEGLRPWLGLWGLGFRPRPQPIVSMSLQPVIPRSGCSPAESASASPARDDATVRRTGRSTIFQRTANSGLTGCLSPGVHFTVSCSVVIAEIFEIVQNDFFKRSEISGNGVAERERAFVPPPFLARR